MFSVFLAIGLQFVLLDIEMDASLYTKWPKVHFLFTWRPNWEWQLDYMIALVPRSINGLTTHLLDLSGVFFMIHLVVSRQVSQKTFLMPLNNRLLLWNVFAALFTLPVDHNNMPGGSWKGMCVTVKTSPMYIGIPPPMTNVPKRFFSYYS